MRNFIYVFLILIIVVGFVFKPVFANEFLRDLNYQDKTILLSKWLQQNLSEEPAVTEKEAFAESIVFIKNTQGSDTLIASSLKSASLEEHAFYNHEKSLTMTDASDSLLQNYGTDIYIPGFKESVIVENEHIDKTNRWIIRDKVFSIQHQINVPEGWSGISSYLIPDNPDIDTIFFQVRDKLEVLFNEQGIYMPSIDSNTLINWVTTQGYIGKFNQPAEILISGEEIPDKEIVLEVGWSIIPVLSECSVNVEELLENVDLILVKDVAEMKMYWPEYGINTLIELLPGKSYYVLMDNPGVIHFPECPLPAWQCGDTLVDERDGEKYNTVLIGSRCWMAENMNIGNVIIGGINSLDNGIFEKYCYDNDTTNCEIYGGLYQWDEMMQYSRTPGTQGICPDGWHLPTDADFTDLITYLEDWIVAGGKMKSTGTIEEGTGLWYYPNTDATNSSGLTGLPAGYGATNGLFGEKGYESIWWSSTERDSTRVWERLLYSQHAYVFRSSMNKNHGFSARCLKDDGIVVNLPPIAPSWPDPPHYSYNIPNNTSLSWGCFDPENDPLTYDLYLGIENPPPLIDTGIDTTFYTPNVLFYNTTYYWKITAHDNHGNSTESETWFFTTEEQNFQCGNLFCDVRDGSYYSTVIIGPQCWMKENLNTGARINGVQNQTNNSTIEKFCFDDLIQNCDVYGGLYQWPELMEYSTIPGVKGICPDGWHLPTDDEWCTLLDYLNPPEICPITGNFSNGVGGMLKDTLLWRFPNIGATNSSGFSALPGGLRNEIGEFSGLLDYAFFWTSNYDVYDFSFYWDLESMDDEIDRYYGHHTKGYSVRCIYDEPMLPGLSVTPENQDVSSLAGITSLFVTSNASWTVTENVSWLSVSPLSGVNSDTLAVNYNENASTSIRVGVIKIIASGGYPEIEVTITQHGINWFDCGQPLIDTRDNRVYSTIEIDDKCWMKQNLDIGVQIVSTKNQSDNDKIEKYCYNDDENLCNIFGGMYQWNELMEYSTTPGAQGICPEGWHVPKFSEWLSLTSHLRSDPIYWCNGDNDYIAKAIASKTNWSSYSIVCTVGNDVESNNASGFTGLPGGYHLSSPNQFVYIGEFAGWVSSNQSGSAVYSGLAIFFDERTYFSSTMGKSGGSYVRCLKNPE